MTLKSKHPEWLIDLAPGARDALAEYARLEEGLAPLHAEERAAIDAGVGLVKWRVDGNGTPVVGPAPGVTTSEFDASQMRKAEAARAIDEYARRLKRAADAFETLMRDAFTLSERRRLAAERALGAHARALVAWSEHKAAMADVSAAYEMAGSPGLHWRTAIGGPMQIQAEAGVHAIDTRLAAFDLDAIAEVAAGEDASEVDPRVLSALRGEVTANGSAR